MIKNFIFRFKISLASFKKMSGLSKKLLICYETILKGGILDNKDDQSYHEPLHQLITNLEEIKSILNEKKNKLYQFLYFSWNSIYDILYNYDEIILLDEEKNKTNKLSDLFYLDLLITKDVCKSFEYSLGFIDYINKDNKIQNMNNGTKNIKNLFLSKIIIELINGFEETDEQKKIIKEIQDANRQIIEKNIANLNEILTNVNKDYFLETKIDEIYANILVNLIKGKKFSSDYENVIKILEELDIENINLTNIMIKKLNDCLDSSEEYINHYKITCLKDLINDNIKIDFYYIFYKYILKNPFYIYQFGFFKNFVSALKKNELNENQASLVDFEIKDKIIYIIKSYTDLDFCKIKGFLNDEEEKINKLLQKYLLIIKFNGRGIFSYNEDNEEGTPNLNNINIETNVNTEFKKNFKSLIDKIFEFSRKIEEINKSDLTLKLESTKKGSNINSVLYNINFKYSILENEKENQKKIIPKSFISNNILINELNRSKGFLYLKKKIKRINEDYPFVDSKKIKDSYSSSSSIATLSNIKGFDRCKFYDYFKIKGNLNKEENLYEIMILEKIIYKHFGSAESINETKNYFYSVGISNDVYIYDKNFNKISNDNLSNTTDDATENLDEIKISDNDIFISSNNGVSILSLDENSKIKTITKKESSIFFFKLDNKTFIHGTSKSLKILRESLNNVSSSFGFVIVGGILISKNIIVFTSNSIKINGQDKIYIYDSENDASPQELITDEYSFTLSKQSLELMPNENGEKKFLLCGCTKYKETQKNGILIINLDNSSNNFFYDSNDFEVFCFCPIFLLTNKNKAKKSQYFTNYFFAGGFESDKRKGSIKLFKINIKEKINIENIEFVQDIIFEKKTVKQIKNKTEEIRDSTTIKNNKKYNNHDDMEYYDFKGFEKNISCIIQSLNTGKILITSWDGNVYLFSEPNISFYLSDDNNN